MINNKEFYILGLPIDTDLGKCKFITIADYPNYSLDLQIISLSKEQTYQKYYEINRDGSLNELLQELKKLSLYEISIGLPEFRDAYYRVFTKVFENEDAVAEINEENFNFYRKLIMDMNCQKEENVNPNPEIQKAIERSRRVKRREGEKMTFADMASSIVAFSGKSYDDINKWTIYQFYMTFYRIAQFKNYDTTTLFATVTDKVQVENWSKHINLFEEEKHSIEHSEFKKTTGSVVSE